MIASASSPPSVTVTSPLLTATFHFPAPSMSKRYELFIPAVFDRSTRPGSVSKNSRALVIAESLSSLRRRESDPLRSARVAGEMPLDEGVGELPLAARQLDAIALQPGRRRTALAELLPLGGEGADLRQQCLDRGAAGAT